MDDQRRDADGGPMANDAGPDLRTLVNGELLAQMDLLLLELERRLYRYARSGSELVHIADEGLLLAVRSRARLAQALASAQHTERHLQVVGIGQWQPTGTGSAWNSDPRVVTDDEPGDG
jgi:hypothetical protein